MPIVHRINNHNHHDFSAQFNKNINGEKVSDDSFLKYVVYEENSAYKKSIIISSATDAQNRNSKEIRKLEIYHDRFGIGQKMVFSQKVLTCRKDTKPLCFLEIERAKSFAGNPQPTNYENEKRNCLFVCLFKYVYLQCLHFMH